jgi:elongation factor G
MAISGRGRIDSGVSMNVYSAKQIRNIALVGHQGAGKTMLAEAMLYATGVINRLGSIEDGSTVSDYHASEKERQMSVFASLIHVEWKGNKINVLDTPGYPDFVGEVVASLRVADAAVFVINAGEGVQVGTELAWAEAEKAGIPVMFVINHLDKPGANYAAAVSEIRERFGRGASVVQLPGGEGSRSIVDVLVMKQLTFPEGKGEAKQSEIDSEFQEQADTYHNELVENIAENDESLMELYFEKGSLDEDEMRQGLHEAMLARQLYPVFATSATQNIGVSRLLSFIGNVCPNPTEMPPAEVDAGDPIVCREEGDPVLFVYRTMSEPHVGDYSFFRVYSGVLESGLDLQNAQTGTSERLGQLFTLNGHERDSAARFAAGDLGAVVKLRNTHSNNTLRKRGSNVVIRRIDYPEPRFKSAVRAVKEGDEEKLAAGFHQLSEEDPSLVIEHDPHLSQIVIGGLGEMQLEIAKYRLKNRFGVDIEYYRPRVAYRETIQTTARASYRHKKQTGGAGQFADISMLVEPLDGEFQPPADIKVRGEATVETGWGSKIQFIDGIVGGVIDMRRFFGAIQKGVLEATNDGPIAGYPVGDVRIVVFDGGMHSVDSNENAFKTAARMCFREAFRQAQPVLLEPIFDLEVMAPESYTGDVMGDLNTRRARIQGVEADGGLQKVIAQAPEAELYRYSTILRSLTQGRGFHAGRFSHYESMPRNVQDKVVAEAAELEEA